MPETSNRWLVIRHILFVGIILVISVGAYYFVRDLTICWRLTTLPGVPLSSCEGQRVDALEPPVIVVGQKAPTPTATPEPPALQTEEYPTWDGASRINILFVGLRGTDPTQRGCPFCTDTLILLTVDPATKTAGMLSIPRDMWVNIPGFGYSRINTAWTLGRGSRLPGGGPELTMKTVAHFIGVPVDYYVQVDFDTFVDIINLIGGVDIHNDETIILDPMAHGRDFPKVKLTCCGTRHLDGRLALAYARCRKESQGCGDGDVGRAKRQQKVIFAIRDKILDPGNFPQLLKQAPQLYNVFSAGIHTNMTLDDAVKLAVMVREIPVNKIKNEVIDHSMMTFGNAILGGQNASVLKPLPDKIRILRDEIFSASGPVSPMAKGDLVSLMEADGARIRLLNGTSTDQLEERTASYLSQQGVQVSEFGETKAQNRTTIVLYSPKLYTLRYLHDVFGVTRSSQILIRPDPDQSVDIEVWLGEDWADMLPDG